MTPASMTAKELPVLPFGVSNIVAQVIAGAAARPKSTVVRSPAGGPLKPLASPNNAEARIVRPIRRRGSMP